MTTPSARARRWPIGLPVAVHPGGGHPDRVHWHGTIHHHRDLECDVGLVDVLCTDPHRFLNNWVGCVTTVALTQLRPDPTAVPSSEPQQPTLFDAP